MKVYESKPSADEPVETSGGEQREGPMLVVPARQFPSEVRPIAPPRSMWREYFQYAAETVVMFLFFMTFTAQAVEVPTGSMQNTILIGDHLLINKFIFAPGTHLPFLPQRDIRRGDIVVFKYPGNDFNPETDTPEAPRYKTYFVKRVIGLPGDRVEIQGEHVLINGQQLPEHIVEAVDRNDKAPLQVAAGRDAPPATGSTYNVYYNPDLHSGDDDPRQFPVFRRLGNGGAITVPSNSYFVMGDNRDNSLDSRFWGFVGRDLVVGRPMFVLWSYDASAPSTGSAIENLISRMRWARIGTWVK